MNFIVLPPFKLIKQLLLWVPLFSLLYLLLLLVLYVFVDFHDGGAPRGVHP